VVTYQFADVCVDLQRLTITRAGAAVEIEPKAFDVLRHLLEHRDRLVTKDELLDTVWRDTFVTPNVLTRAIAQLRRALGDDARDARYIETVAKRGYRFIAPVTVAAEPAAAAPLPIPPPIAAAAANAWLWWSTAIVLLTIAAAGVAVLARRPPRPMTWEPMPAAVRLTTRGGTNTTPALSPDGHAAAFASDRTGSLEIYVVGLAPGSEEVAITNDGGQNMEPAWSPDGRWIAFHSRRRGGIWIAPSTGGTPQQIVERGSNAAWSADSGRLVYTPDEGGTAGVQVLWTVNLDGSDRRQLTQRGHPAGGHNHPAWSHDGRFIVFAVSNGSVNDAIWIVEAGGGTPRRLTAAKAAGSPQFSPRDTAVFWTGTAAPYNGRIFRIGFDPARGAASGEPMEMMPFENGMLHGLSIARDGSAVFGVETTDANLWTIDLRRDGTATEAVRLTDDAVRSGRPDYSRDGRIAFFELGPGRPTSVWTIDEHGGDRVQLMAGASAGDPSWSADGSRVLVSSHAANRCGLWWIDPSSRRATRTAIGDGDIRSPRVSPDSRTIAFHVLDASGSLNVWTQPLDGGPRRRVTDDREAASYPSWSPDGQWLAVEVQRGERTQIGVVAAGGGAVDLLTDTAGQSWPHSWSPDGEHIVYAAERDAVWNVWEVSRRTRAARQLTHFISSSGYVRYPSWSPRGDRIVFERETRTATVWTVRLAASD
jgi:Tol biopolymer transport system component/DNA-binding winged helix-turn-helix (wHTH) protein